MSSLSDVLNIASSGLQTAQTQVRVISDNVANVNTPGYSRKVVTQSELTAGGQGQGVNVTAIQRAANQFLQQASLSASSGEGSAQVLSDFMSQAQQLFGDPSSSTSFFAGLDNVYAAFSTAAGTPSSTLDRSSALTAVSNFLSSANSVSSSLSGLESETNQRITADVGTINNILSQLTALNSNISTATVSGGDPSGSQDQQSQLLDQLSSLIKIQVQPTATGGVTVRSADGVLLAGDQGAATLNYSTSGAAGILTAAPPPKGVPQTIQAGGGEVGGLLELGQVDLPKVSAQLGEFVSQAVDQLNAAHNASTSVPPPATLTGSAMGTDLTTALNGFTGKTTIAITDSSGVMQQRVDIDFGAHTMSVNGGATTTFTNANFLTSLNTALGTAGAASYTNGVLKLSANSGGVAIADDPTTPSNKIGEGFSQFFGLNNLVESPDFTDYSTGMTLSSPNPFNAGGQLTLQLADASGSAIRQAVVTVPSGGTVGDLLNGLNTAMGAYGSFSLDGTGQLSFTPAGTSGVSVSVVSDSTQNSNGGPTMSQMFGIGDGIRAQRAASFTVRADIAADPSKLALAQLDLTQSVGGSPALGIGDGRGADAIASSGEQTTQFSAAGGLPAIALSVSGYASEMSGYIGAQATNASDTQQTASALATQASTQRSTVEGVNLDQELVNLTTYQQSYSACARLMTAAQSMYDVLLQVIP
jgi:flagellar hook-associated protein 1 FlgK